MIKVTCGKCGTSFNASDSAAGKTGKCKACQTPITVPSTAIITSKTATPEIIIQASPAKKSKLAGLMGGLAAALPKGDSDDVKKAKILAKTIAAENKRKAWNKFWFQVRIGMLTVFLSFVGLIAWVAYVGKDSPRVTYIAPAANPVAAPSAPVAEQKKGSFFDGKKPEGKIEKIYEKVTGKEVVHKKDGTTYERRQPKKD